MNLRLQFPRQRGRKILVERSPKIIPALVIGAAFILAVAIPWESPWAQRPPKDKMNSSPERKAGGRYERNPFLLPLGVHLHSPSKVKRAPETKEAFPKRETKSLDIPAEVQPAPLRVKAVLISDRIRLAVIDRYILTEGDAIRDEKLLKIETDRVILGKGDQKRTLLLSQSHLPIIVEKE
jgi:hypothetical protein